MSSTTEAKKTLALAAISNEQLDMSDPNAWTRIRKFKHGNIVFRDFESANNLIVARVKEIDGIIDSVLFLSHAQLEEIHILETTKPGRPWTDGGDKMCEQSTHEFAFGVASNQLEDDLHLLITPASYYVKTGEPWPDSHIDSALIPTWLNQVTHGVFKSNITDISELKAKLHELGFIETDSLSDYHAELIYETSNNINAGVPF